MIRTLLLACTVIIITIPQVDGQQADFESFDLEVDTFLNGSDGGGGFREEDLFFPNTYEDTFGSWSGWSISTDTDVTTAGFTNQYASIAGGGADGSQHYATSFVSGSTRITAVFRFAPEVLSVSNNTYAFLSMRDGDSFAKKFGGETGEDPDFFLLTIKGYRDGQLQSDSVDHYLADFRFADNSQDYIQDDWMNVDLTAIGFVDSLEFTLSSSDNGAFGMNTPAYFCIDNFSFGKLISTDEIASEVIRVFPNPSSDYVYIDLKNTSVSQVIMTNSCGQVSEEIDIYNSGEKLDIRHLNDGIYFITVYTNDNKVYTHRIIKQ